MLRRSLLMATMGLSGPEAELSQWLARVAANGGSVSQSTKAAVLEFCTTINQEPGLRERITRLNLFCGDQLEAALTPLYVSESVASGAKGNSVDANNNFVSGDYQPTGSSGGLVGNGSTKYLNTGLAQSQYSAALSSHLSISGTGLSTTTTQVYIGSYTGAASGLNDLLTEKFNGSNLRTGYRHGNFIPVPDISPISDAIHLLGNASVEGSSLVLRTYVNGVSQAGVSVPSALSPSTRTVFIFALNNAGSPAAFTSARMRMYSIGAGLTSAQVSAFNSAVSAFNTSLGR